MLGVWVRGAHCQRLKDGPSERASLSLICHLTSEDIKHHFSLAGVKAVWNCRLAVSLVNDSFTPRTVWR